MLVVINLLFLIFWMWRRKWYFIVSLVILLIGINPISRTYQFKGKQANEQGSSAPRQSQLKVMSYNVRVFGLVGRS